MQSAPKLLLDVYKEKTKHAVPDDLSQLDFQLRLSDPKQREVLAVSKWFKLPDNKKVLIDYILQTHPNEGLKDFLFHTAPEKTNVFVFGWGYKKGENRASVEMYVQGLERALKNVTTEVWLSYWVHSKDSLERLIKASANAERIVIRNSQLDLENALDLKGPSYKTSYLSLAYCGDSAGDNWGGKPERLGRLLKAIGESSLKSSLCTLNILKCGLKTSKVTEMLKNNGLGHVNVIEENPSPSTG